MIFIASSEYYFTWSLSFSRRYHAAPIPSSEVALDNDMKTGRGNREGTNEWRSPGEILVVVIPVFDFSTIIFPVTCYLHSLGAHR